MSSPKNNSNFSLLIDINLHFVLVIIVLSLTAFLKNEFSPKH